MVKIEHKTETKQLFLRNFQRYNMIVISSLVLIMSYGCGGGSKPSPGNTSFAMPGIQLHSSSILEGHGGETTLQFEVTLSPSRGSVVSLDYRVIIPDEATIAAATEEGVELDVDLAMLTAVQGECVSDDARLACRADVAGVTSGKVVFAPDQISQKISVTVMGDELYERDEILAVVIENPEGANLAEGVSPIQIGFIENDDAVPTATIAVLDDDGNPLSEATETTRQLELVLSKESGVDAEMFFLMTSSSKESFGQEDVPRYASYKGDFIIYDENYNASDLDGKDCDPRPPPPVGQQWTDCDTRIRIDAETGKKFRMLNSNANIVIPAGVTKRTLTLRVINDRHVEARIKTDGSVDAIERIALRLKVLSNEHVKPLAGSREVALEIEDDDQSIALLKKPLNDTGVTTSIVGDNEGLQDDARLGRDANVDLIKVGSGRKGFDVTPLDALGDAVTENAQARCVRDNVTGLIWEVKIGANAGLQAVAKKGGIFWYNPDYGTNGGEVGALSAIKGQGASDCSSGECNTMYYEMEISLMKLCGLTQWRLPTLNELRGIADYQSKTTLAYETYFPGEGFTTTGFWAANPHHDSSRAYTMSYKGAPEVEAQIKSFGKVVRLVNDTQITP